MCNNPNIKKKKNIFFFHTEDIADNPSTDPATIYNSFILIAEGESGPLYAAKHIGTNKVVTIDICS